jgi:hypothetical protein
MKLCFSDGVEIEVDGPLRTLHLDDGWYVTGEGILFAMDSEAKALAYIESVLGRRNATDPTPGPEPGRTR